MTLLVYYGLHTLHGSNPRAIASDLLISILLSLRCLQLPVWYFVPVLVIYTIDPSATTGASVSFVVVVVVVVVVVAVDVVVVVIVASLLLELDAAGCFVDEVEDFSALDSVVTTGAELGFLLTLKFDQSDVTIIVPDKSVR
ncbi:MAG: hypothetical protein PHR78_00045 [Eubacteriales bacterium]|nr:hypothetical protein [Eubacteriales bacterium]MDD4540549.1 hypothetical protein [Eubacteriales bacterium]